MKGTRFQSKIFVRAILASLMVFTLACPGAILAEEEEADMVHITPAREEAPAESKINPMKRLGAGASNVFYSFFELPYRTVSEIRRTDLVRGLLPGVVKGFGWAGTRFGVGLYEMGTCAQPLESTLPPFDANFFAI
jgi:putative exosortase-associated protein (TIGR04073 family)